MQFNVRIAAVLSAEMLEERINNIREPAVLLGGDMKIIAKNPCASKLFFDLRKGRKIRKFLPEEYRERLSDMHCGDTADIRLVNGNRRYKAIAVCGENFRFIVIQSAAPVLREELGRIYGKSSGYDVSVTEPESKDYKYGIVPEDMFMPAAENCKADRYYSIFNVSSILQKYFQELMGAASFFEG